MQALLFILNTLLTLVVVAYLLRVLMPWCGPIFATRSDRRCSP